MRDDRRGVALAIDAGAEGIGRHDRGGASRDAPARERAKETPPAQAQDPYAALERELPSLVEDERMKAEAAADLKRHLDALYALLDDSQKRTLDRRVVQSQTDPLGR